MPSGLTLSLAALLLPLSAALAEPPRHVPGELIVRLQPGAGKPAAALISAAGLDVLSVRAILPARAGRAKPSAVPPAFLLRYRGALPPGEAARRLASAPGVVWAEPNHLFHALSTPNDPSFPNQTNLVRIGWPQMRDVLGPALEDVVIAIIDSGVDYRHPDLAQAIWTNAAEADGLPGVDDDGNGYVDDVRGWDFTDAPSLPGKGDYVLPDNDPMDESGHGTSVAGVAGAVTDNGIVIAGVSDAKLMALRAGLSFAQGGTFLEEDDLAAAIFYAVDNGARVLNLSWGSPETAFLIEDAVRYAAGAGVVVVAAAGNEAEGVLSHPAAMSEVIAVGAVDNNDRLAPFSSFGPTIDLVAPGLSVLSTLPGAGVGAVSGTSFSAPHVAGLCAIALSRAPGLSAEEVRGLLVATAADLGASGWDGVYGAGRIDAAALALALSPAPAPVTAVISSPRSGRAVTGPVDVAWRATGAARAYRLSYGLGDAPASWVPIRSGTAPSEDAMSWQPPAAADTSVVLRLEVDGPGVRVEDRALLRLRPSSPRITGVWLGPVLDGPEVVYHARWTTDEPTEGYLLVRSTASGLEDTLAAPALNTSHEVALPDATLRRTLELRVMARNLAGDVAVTNAEPLTLVPGRVPSDGFREIAALPDGFLPDRPSDFDGDGRAEIALMPYVEGKSFSPVQIHEWQGTAFDLAYETAASFLPWSVGDVTLDGRDDLLATDVARARVLSGAPFPDAVLLDRQGAWGSAIADVDGDGPREVLLRSSTKRGLHVFRKGATGAFSEVAFLEDFTGGSGEIGPRPVIADLDGDGRRDILLGDGDGDLFTYHAVGGAFERGWSLAGSDATDARIVGGGADLDGDGAVEFVVARATADDEDRLGGTWDIEIYGPKGTSRYALEWTQRVTGIITPGNGIATGDLDGDGRPDLAVCLLPDLYVFRADGPDAYRPIWHRTVGLTHRPLIADLDGDGRPELMFNQGGAVRVLEREGGAAASPRPEIVDLRPLDAATVRLRCAAVPDALFYRFLRATGEDTAFTEFTGGALTEVYDRNLPGGTYAYAVEASLPGGNVARSSTRSVRTADPARLIDVASVGDRRVALLFSKPLPEDAADPNLYRALPDLGRPSSAIRDRGDRRIVLTFGSPFDPRTPCTLRLSGLFDRDGVPVPVETVTFTPGAAADAARADFDGSGTVDFPDFVRFASAYGSADPAFDLDGDGGVGFSDFILFARVFGHTVA